jgi:hypothetical protein
MGTLELVGTLAQNTGGSGSGGGIFGAMFLIVWVAFWLAVMVFMIAAIWKVFTKAGQPGWAAIIPIYNMYIMCKIGGRPGWWVLLFFIPIVNIVISAMVSIDIAKSFGKDVGFGIGLWLLAIVFYPILGFGSAQYQGPAAA